MAKIRIDEGWLLMAFDSGDGMESWYLDRQTGEVIRLGEYGDLDEDDELRERIDEDEEDRFLSIPSLSSHEGFRIMEDFAASQSDGRVREALFDALDRRRPFRSFKDALNGLGEVRDQWFRYQENRLREHARAWLESEEIDAELVPFIDRSGEAQTGEAADSS
jgi:uncharacterized protein UPF0158